MLKSRTIYYDDSLIDNDSGVSLDYNYASSNDLHSSLTLNESLSPYVSRSSTLSSLPFSPATTSITYKRSEPVEILKYTSNGLIQRIRPTTMRNGENGDSILCQTDRGTFTVHRTPVVPEWIRRLVAEVEARER